MAGLAWAALINSFSVHNPDGPEADLSDVDAEAEAAEAEARAEEARARLAKLREDAGTPAAAPAAEQHSAQSARARRLRLPRRPRRPRWLRLPRRRTVAAVIGVVVATASLASSGYMVWEHRAVVHKRQLATELRAAAEKEVTALLSIDANHAKEDFQRIIDESTGNFKNQLEPFSGLLAKQTAESKISGKATVEAIGVESMGRDSGVVLVAAKLDVTNPDNTHRPPVVYRISVDLTRDGGQLRMSKVDFLQ